MSIGTGYWDDPVTQRATKVHLVKGRKPLCNSQIGSHMEYQWCAMRPIWHYVDCEHCKRIHLRMRDRRRDDHA